MKLLRPLACLAVLLAALTFAHAEFEPCLKNYKGAFVLLDGQTGSEDVCNPQRAAEQLPPWSTFKIPSTLIALETGSIKSADTLIKWDQALYPAKDNFLPEWNQDMDAAKAFRYSCVWFHKELAKKAGEEQMARFVNQFGYGNRDTSGGLTNFWLGSSLKISALGQARFLRKLHERKLGLSERTYDIAERDIFIEEQTDDYVLRAKTGSSGLRDDGTRLCWYVGYVTRGGRTWYFALNLDIPDGEDGMKVRKGITRAILRERGIIGGNGAS